MPTTLGNGWWLFCRVLARREANPSNFCADCNRFVFIHSSCRLCSAGVGHGDPLPLAYCFQYLLLGGTSCGTRAPEGTRFGPRLSLTFLLPGQPLQRSQTSRTLSHVLVGNMSLWIIIKGQCWQCRESLRAHFLPRQSAGAG